MSIDVLQRPDWHGSPVHLAELFMMRKMASKRAASFAAINLAGNVPPGRTQSRLPDGRELFFIASDGKMMSVPLGPGSMFRHGKPVPLFPAGDYYINVARDYDVSADGRRFYMVKNAAGPGTRSSMVWVTRWFDGVRATMRAAR
jgi:hypothetical protein